MLWHAPYWLKRLFDTQLGGGESNVVNENRASKREGQKIAKVTEKIAVLCENV